MKKTIKNRKLKSSNLPSSIGFWAKIVGSIAGFCCFGVEFIWVILGWQFICSVVGGVIRVAFRILVLWGLISFLMNLL